MNISLGDPEDAATLTRLIRQTSNAKQRDRYRAVALAIDGHPTLDVMAMLDRSRGFVQRSYNAGAMPTATTAWRR